MFAPFAGFYAYSAFPLNYKQLVLFLGSLSLSLHVSLLISSCCIWQQIEGYFCLIQNQYCERINFATARKADSEDLLQSIDDSLNSLLPLLDVYL